MFKDKEGEISSLRKQVFQAKEDGKTEFRNSNAFLYELDDCFVDGFNDCLQQVKASFLDLELSQISIDTVAQTPAKSIELEGTDELFKADPTLDAQGDGETALQDE